MVILIEKKVREEKEKTSEETDDFIINLIENNDNLCLTDIKNILEDNDIILSMETIRSRLIENNYVYKSPIKKPLLTEAHKKKIEVGN